MASQTSFSRDPVAKSTGLESIAGTPPDTVLPLTPPASDEQRATSEFNADEWIRAVEDSRDPSGSHRGAAQIKLLPKHYEQAIKTLKRHPSLDQYVEDKAR